MGAPLDPSLIVFMLPFILSMPEVADTWSEAEEEEVIQAEGTEGQWGWWEGSVEKSPAREAEVPM